MRYWRQNVFKMLNLNVFGCHFNPLSSGDSTNASLCYTWNTLISESPVTLSMVKNYEIKHIFLLQSVSYQVGNIFCYTLGKTFYHCLGRTLTAKIFLRRTLLRSIVPCENFVRNSDIIYLRSITLVSGSTQKWFCFDKPIFEQPYLGEMVGGPHPFNARI